MKKNVKTKPMTCLFKEFLVPIVIVTRKIKKLTPFTLLSPTLFLCVMCLSKIKFFNTWDLMFSNHFALLCGYVRIHFVFCNFLINFLFLSHF